jgi:hypothetical protein
VERLRAGVAAEIARQRGRLRQALDDANAELAELRRENAMLRARAGPVRRAPRAVPDSAIPSLPPIPPIP